MATTKTATQAAPKKGQTMTVRGQEMTIVRVWPFGTVDVENSKGERFRVTGLPFLRAE